MTYSIVARDPKTGELGIAVASKFFAAGAIVPFLGGPRGAVASQALPNPQWGTQGLARLNAGEDPQAVLDDMVARDAGRDHRQCHMIDIDGRIAQFTGDACPDWAGHASADNVSAAGNILAGERVVTDMIAAFQDSADQPLAARLLAALDAAEAAGGDSRGRQSAGLVVGRGEDWRLLDLRVDDHAEPLVELRRLYEVAQELYLPVIETLPTRDSASWTANLPALNEAFSNAEARLAASDTPSRSQAWDRPAGQD